MSKNRQTQKITKRERNDRLTNWYMINLCWGVVGILALLAIQKGYQSGNTILAMSSIIWTLTGIFAAGTVALLVVGIKKDSSRMTHYGILTGVSALVTLWLAFYNQIRPVLETIARAVLQNPTLSVSSYWNVRIPMTGIGIYLVAAFIYFAIKVTRK